MCVTHRELRARRPWNASGAISDIWLLLRSLWMRNTFAENKKKKKKNTTRGKTTQLAD